MVESKLGLLSVFLSLDSFAYLTVSMPSSVIPYLDLADLSYFEICERKLRFPVFSFALSFSLSTSVFAAFLLNGASLRAERFGTS